MEMGKKRLAVLVGCNYPNSQYQLQGCINDVMAMKEALLGRFGFQESQIEVLTDEPGSKVMPTGANIKKALDRLVQRAETGDVLFFHYSGHGTRIPSLKHTQPLRKDEAIVPCDFNLITDMDFRHLVNRLPKGASFTIISDSCHSGGLIDQEKEQIGPSSSSSKSKPQTHGVSKTIPYETLLQHFMSLTNLDSSDIGAHLVHHFGEEASLKFRLHPDHPLFGASRSDNGILLSGCQANETSADRSPDEVEGGKSYGAFSNSVQEVLKVNPGPLSYKDLVLLARKKLKAEGSDQHPCLYCSDQNADAAFLWQRKA